MKLSELTRLARLDVAIRTGGVDAEVSRPMWDSRQVKPGDLFICMPSARTDSHSFIFDAAKAGASAVVLHDESGQPLAEKAGLAWLLPEDFEPAIGHLCHALLGFPTKRLKVIGVTGTNGKTTTAWLLKSMLTTLGENAAYLGTLGYVDKKGLIPLENTTPIAPELATLLAGALERGCTAVAMEVSSHSLAQHRVDGVEFDAAVFTNLTQDHLDFHGTMEAYEAAKFQLFKPLTLPKAGRKLLCAAINRDDPVGSKWLSQLSQNLTPANECELISFGTTPPSLNLAETETLSAQATEVRLTSLNLSFTLTPKRILKREYTQSLEGSVGDPGTENSLDHHEVKVPLGGNFNIENSLSAVAGCLALGYELGSVVEALGTTTPVPGRFEPVSTGLGFDLIVDYAHTPDALEKLLNSVRPLTSGKLITVFGCGGDRDRTKRPKMARAASSLSDIVVLTSDNPRTEDPKAIMAEVALGLEAGIESYQVEDRPEAIELAVALAQPGDAVVIAGKGHEDYQIVGRQKFPMDDRELARKALQKRPEFKAGGLL